jgi:hypothetical protein
MRKEPFTIAVSDATLADLRERLLKTRWPRDFANAQWQFISTTGANRNGR